VDHVRAARDRLARLFEISQISPMDLALFSCRRLDLSLIRRSKLEAAVGEQAARHSPADIPGSAGYEHSCQL
jgi:hypothetical protein